MKKRAINSSVQKSVEEYLREMEDEPVQNLYQMVLAEVEPPLLAAVLKHTGKNQSRAARMLGLSRGTLRKKLRQYGLL